MLSLIHPSTARSLVSALLIACLFSLSAPMVIAAEGPRHSDKSATRDTSPSSEVASSAAEARPRVLYVPFADVMNGPADPAPEAPSRPRTVARLVESVNVASTPPIPVPVPQQSSSVVSTAPMTAGEKFGTWFRSKFLSPGALGTAVFNGVWKELRDNDDFKKDTVENYFADTMTRTARSYAGGTTNAFFEKALFASLFRQDPRYHRSNKTGAGAKLTYALTRVIITQGDRCGCHQFNYSFLLGGAAGAGVANLWERRERTGPFHTLSRYYNHVVLTALFNVVKEFVGGQ